MIDEPNVVLPLATSYNERGVAGFTHVVTNGEDQRKVNCFYEVGKNPLTGKGTLTLSKRPGVTKVGSSLGSAEPLVFLITRLFDSGTGTDSAIFYVDDTNNIKCASSGGVANIITASAGGIFFPAYVDITAVSKVTYVVAEFVTTSDVAHRVFYSTVSDVVASGGVWTQISDGDFTTSAGGVAITHRGKAEHLDGYMFKLTSNNLIINSDTNSLQNWTAGSFLAKQIRQDVPKGLARLGNQIIGLGEETMEVFYNAGNAVGSPLGRIPYLHQRVGLVSLKDNIGVHYYATVGKSIYFVGRGSGNLSAASIGLYTYDGQTAIKVSPSYIDKILVEKINAISSVYSISVNGQVGIAISLTLVGTADHRSLIFFPEWKEWFEWTSSVFSTVNNGTFFVASGTVNGTSIYKIATTDKWQDDTTSYQWLTQFRVPSSGSSLHRMGMYGVDADTDTSANLISVEASDNDCASFYSLQSFDLTQDRKMNFRGGAYRKRHIRLTATDARPKRIHSFLARVD